MCVFSLATHEFLILRVTHTSIKGRNRTARGVGEQVAFQGRLKGPKHEIFEGGFFTQIRPVRLDDLGTGEKIWHFAS